MPLRLVLASAALTLAAVAMGAPSAVAASPAASRASAASHTSATSHASHASAAGQASTAATGFPATATGWHDARPTAANDFSFDSFTADYTLGRDQGRNATLGTVERLVAEFPESDQNHGIERDIPTSYGDVNLELHVTSVTDADGTALPYKLISTPYDYSTLRIGDPDRYVHGRMTYVIRYQERNVVRSFADTDADEFYRDVNGTEWSEPFGVVTARVHLAPGLSEHLTGKRACYQGAQGSGDTCRIVRTTTGFAAGASDLDAHENVTIAVGFTVGTFAKPPVLRENWFYAVVPWLLAGLAVIVLAWALRLRVFVWRNAAGRGTIIAEYAPPPGVHPALAAELLRRRKRAFAAQIVGFAVNKVVRIRQFPGEAKRRQWELELIAAEPQVDAPERTILRTLFGNLAAGATVRLDPTDRTLGDRLSSHTGDEAARLVSLGWRARPVSKSPRRIGWSVLALIAATIGHTWLASSKDATTDWTVLTTTIVIVAGIAAWVLATPPLLLTESGAAVRDALLGLRMYIRLAEADRIRVLQEPGTAQRVDVTNTSSVVALNEKLLPYAMIWGVERQWIRELESQYSVTQAPDWYSGSSGLTGLVVMSSVVGSGHFATTPTASSSGGFGGGSSSGGSGGGGFSGGGGGGGGGGGW